VTYGEVTALIAESYNKTQQLGIKQGEAVVLFGDYSPELFCMMLALAGNGNIVIPLTHKSVVEQTLALSISGCDWRIEFAKNAVIPNITRHMIPTHNTLLANFRGGHSAGLVLFSSGSTGTPKGILHDFNRVTDKFRKPHQPIVAIPFLNLDHFGGINTILAITASLGTVVTVADRSVAHICAAIESYKVELLPTTPSFLTLLIASKLYEKYDLSSLKRITYGTEVMPQATLDRVCTAFPNVQLQQTYGLSEIGVLHSRSRDNSSLWMSIGGNGFQTKVVDNILWIKSDYSMVGYLNAPSDFDEEGWFNTHDLVEVDGDYFRILGRSTDLINVGGQKVYPTEVENVILEMDNIEDVAVFGEKNNLRRKGHA
jgi:acyl-CoA synthetase (AMP-forming)/AMP-acid ligase II